MDLEAAILESDLVKLRRLLARSMAGNHLPDELIHRANQRRVCLDMLFNAETAKANEDLHQMDMIIADARLRMPAFMTVAYAFDMQQWLNEYFADRNAISSRRDLERAVTE